MTGIRHMWPATKVGEIPLLVERQHFVRRDILDNLGLVRLGQSIKKLYCLVTTNFASLNRNLLLCQLGHAFLDFLEVFRCEGTLIGKVVIEAIFNNWPNGDLCIREQLLDRLCHQMRS